jgi:hypothetical protein
MRRDWKQLILRVEPDATFQEPASVKSLRALETGLDVTLPPDLRELLQVSDGVEGSYGLGVIWPCARILEDNTRFRESKQFRELYMPFDSLLFFADAGNGDQFAYPIATSIHRPDVFVWNHEDDSRTWVAPGLAEYLEWWLTGKLSI